MKLYMVIVAAIAALLPLSAAAQSTPTAQVGATALYPLVLHIGWTHGDGGNVRFRATLGNKYIELEGVFRGSAQVVPLGDYHARIAKERLEKNGSFSREYDLLLSDGKPLRVWKWVNTKLVSNRRRAIGS